MALAGSLPGFTIIVPADAIEARQAVKAAAATYGPFYIRLGRPKAPLVYTDDYRFVLGKAATMKQGKDVTIIAIGLMVAAAVEAAANLMQEGIDCRVLNISTLKPIDEAAVIKAATETGAIVTAEEHLEHGGLGSTIVRLTAQHQPVPVEFVAIKDTYAKSGKPADLLQRHNLTARDIEQAVRTVIKRK
jgi:transketolase